MNIILERVTAFLLESRISDVKKKYPNADPDVIDFFVQNDPSGNQKYLDWMVKASTHTPTIISVNSSLGINYDLLTSETVQTILSLVTEFNSLLPYMVYTEDGVQQGTKDLYQYKFSDSEMINYLIFDIEQAKGRKKIGKQKEEAKKGGQKIYNDSNWLVVRPKTYESSCYYGAGTKWCTTSKTSSSHFKRETENDFLIYVINKNQTSESPLYKVAWQIPFRKNTEIVIKPNGEVNTSYLKLWNAEDNSFQKSNEAQEYIESIPSTVRATISSYIKKEMEELYANKGFSEEPEIQAIVEYLALTQEEIDSIDKERWTNYGLNTYVIGERGDAYSVGDSYEVASALEEWVEQYIDDSGMWHVLSNMYNPEKYISINDTRSIAYDDATNRIEDMSDEEVLESANHYSSLKPLVEDHGILSMILENFEEEEEQEVDDSFEREEITREEYFSLLDDLEKKRKDLEKRIDSLFKQIRDGLEAEYIEEQVDRMTNDPKDWLSEMGYWDRKDGLSQEAFRSGLIDVSYPDLVTDLVNDFNYEVLSSTGEYNTVTVAGTEYYIFPTDV